MKIKIDKTLREGRYWVYVEVSDFSTEELTKMQTFGAPKIDLSPKSVWYKNRIATSLPLNEIKNFFIFKTSSEANSFATTMKSKIDIAIRFMRARRDTFSSSKEYEV